MVGYSIPTFLIVTGAVSLPGTSQLAGRPSSAPSAPLCRRHRRNSTPRGAAKTLDGPPSLGNKNPLVRVN